MVAGHLQQKKGYYYIVLNYKDDTGKTKTKWISTKLPVKGNKRKAEAMLLEARQNFEITPTTTVEEVTFVQYMKDWLEMMKPNIELTTYVGYSLVVNSIISPYFSGKEILLRDLQPKHIQDFYTHCMNVRGVSAATVLHYHANIRKALKYAVNTDILPSNPADKIQRPKKQKFVGSFYDIDEMNTLFRAVRGTKIELIVKLAAFYGLRRSEVLGLRWDAIDFKKKTLTIRHTIADINVDGERMTVKKDRTKNRASYRTLPLVAEFAEILSSLQRQQDEYKKLCGHSYNQAYLEYVCVDEMGNLMKPGYLTKHFTDALRENNLRKIRFHDLRHSCASLLLANGVPMKQIQEWLGHSDFGTTANIYAHLDVSAKLSSANAMLSAGMALTANV